MARMNLFTEKKHMDKANTAQPRRVQLHQEKENNKQDEEAEKPPPVKPTGKQISAVWQTWSSKEK